jgi:hypothetical protein
MNFVILDEITEIETIGKGSGIREVSRLRKLYGHGNWKKEIFGVNYGRINNVFKGVCGLYR